MAPGRLREVVENARRKLARDRAAQVGPLSLLRKGARYAAETLSAPWYLRAATDVGPGVRTLGQPRIVNQGRLVIGAGTLLRSIIVPVELVVGPEGTLELGRDVRLNYGVSLGARGSVRLGARCRLGPFVRVVDVERHDLEPPEALAPPRPVVLEHDVWVGAKASILPGVTIGAWSVVGTGAVVREDVPPYTVVAGVPARVLRQLDPARFAPADE